MIQGPAYISMCPVLVEVHHYQTAIQPTNKSGQERLTLPSQRSILTLQRRQAKATTSPQTRQHRPRQSWYQVRHAWLHRKPRLQGHWRTQTISSAITAAAANLRSSTKARTIESRCRHISPSKVSCSPPVYISEQFADLFAAGVWPVRISLQ